MLDEACTLVGAALRADKVDVFLYEDASHSLVAMGTSATLLGQRQRAIGLNRQPIANGGAAVRVFESGMAYLTGRADQDFDQLRGMVDGLGIRSSIDVPIEVAGQRRGILQADAQQTNFFTERDLNFLEAVAGWIGIVTHRAELVGQAVLEGERRGRHQAADELRRITQREQEVAILIADGLTNAEIAERLVLALGTVSNHVMHILRKLGLHRRTQIAVWAVQCDLYRPDLDDGRGSELASP
jgi:DNA-binding CsgD family transcriptional regulator